MTGSVCECGGKVVRSKDGYYYYCSRCGLVVDDSELLVSGEHRDDNGVPIKESFNNKYYVDHPTKPLSSREVRQILGHNFGRWLYRKKK